MKTKKVAFLGMCIALSMILSFVESQIPPLMAVPGVKVGLPNIVMVFMLYKIGAKETAIVSILRVILVGILFGTPLSMIYSLVGAALSLIGMILLKKTNLFAPITVSVAGGILHNIGQIATACLVMETAQIAYYLPVLLISGTIAGILIGLTAAMILKRLDKMKL
ncbi:MAG: Gx transporter family protein [Clostridia bacterium]|nr:Gx transporter family protein [Clostridia bacterium]MBQ3229316.1 Gx transporter family protein [Clostridia bacterium]MBR4062967.1 Gx transporter family protein [Clostridia bacterium]MBR6577745.1 Gx transporter family protein [Clostridia bacterium]